VSLRSEARDLAARSVRDAASSFGSEAIDAIERRLQWRWDNAPLLYFEAEHMVFLLEQRDGGVIRRARLWHWRNRQERFAAKAWAQDPAFAERCGICRKEGASK
jgi:hypothetical protein